MNDITMQLVADKYIKMALEEDINSEDISTNAVMPEYKKGEVTLLAKQDGIIAGLQVFKRVFTMLDPNTEVIFAEQDGKQIKDGDAVTNGQVLATVVGDIRVLLSGERTALNYLQRMSGIATYTNNVAALLKGTNTKLLDTRKTTPCMRIFEKYAVRAGGGNNHRYNLSDAVMLKDNHIGRRRRCGKGSSDGKRLCIICLQNRGRDRESGYGQRSSGSRCRYHHVR